MFLMTKRTLRWLLVFILIDSLALVALASLAMRQMIADYPRVVKIKQYTYEAEATRPHDFTNLLSYDPRMHYLDIRSTLGIGCLVSLLAGVLVVLDGSGAPKLRRSFASCEKNDSGKTHTLRAVTLVDYALYLTVLILTCIVWSVFSDAQKELNMNNPLLPNNHVDETVSYGPVPKDHWFTFETWNCALAPYITLDHEPGPSRGFISRRCRQLKATRFLILPLLIASSLRVAIITWTERRRHSLSDRKKIARGETNDASMGIELHSDQVHSEAESPASEIFEAPALDVSELPGSSGKMAEAPGSGVAELPGDGWYNELEAEAVAVEAPTK